jgi:hypothetical protein
MDMVSPDPGVDAACDALSAAAADPVAMGRSAAGWTRAYLGYVNSVNLQAYVESYLEPAVRNANIMYVNKFVSERMWKIFFSDIIKAYLSKRTAVRRKDGT